jgi:hypothetical protein
MTAHREWRDQVLKWRNGHTGDPTILKATATYLEVSANWVEIRDFLITMAMSKRQILDWFAAQDFPDFRDAVEEGWGWPKELEDA